MDNVTFSKLDEQESASPLVCGDFSLTTERNSDRIIHKEPEFNITGTALNIL